MCVEKVLTWGEFGARAGGKGGKIRDDDEYKLKDFHEYATLRYTTDSNWCHENKKRVFNTSKTRYLGLEKSKRPDNVGYVGEVDDENTYKSFSVNDTMIKRCISCADILADVRLCVAKKNDPLNPVSGTPSVCDSHSQSIISECAGKMCPSSMNVEDTEVLIGVVDFPALMVSNFGLSNRVSDIDVRVSILAANGAHRRTCCLAPLPVHVRCYRPHAGLRVAGDVHM
jgi:hypothetical protein